MPRGPEITRLQAEIAREPHAVFRWWTATDRIRELREHWKRLAISAFTWHEDVGDGGRISAVEASWRSRTGAEVVIRRSYVRIEGLRSSSRTVAQSTYPDGRREVTTSERMVDFLHLGTSDTLVRLINRWEATGIHLSQRLPSARYRRRDHIKRHLDEAIEACLRATEPRPTGNDI